MARKVLGVGPGASAGEVRAAWKARVKRDHPDRAGGSAARLMRANLAYEVLMAGSGEAREAEVAKPSKPERRSGRRGPKGVAPVPEGAQAQGEAQLAAARQRQAFSQAVAGNGGFYVDPRRVREGAAVGAQHVASGVEMDGRWVLFVVEAPMQAGDNEVALPLGERDCDRPVVVRFEAAERGGGRIVLGEAERAVHFPWAEAVEIAFRAA